jgi:hypothetical protein
MVFDAFNVPCDWAAFCVTERNRTEISVLACGERRQQQVIRSDSVTASYVG